MLRVPSSNIPEGGREDVGRFDHIEGEGSKDGVELKGEGADRKSKDVVVAVGRGSYEKLLDEAPYFCAHVR